MFTDAVDHTPVRNMSHRSDLSASSQPGVKGAEWKDFQPNFNKWYEDCLQKLEPLVGTVKEIIKRDESQFEQARKFVTRLNETSQRVQIDAQLIPCMQVLKATSEYAHVKFGMHVEASTELSERSTGGYLDYVFGQIHKTALSEEHRRIYLEAKGPHAINLVLQNKKNTEFIAQGAAGAANLNPEAAYCNVFAIYDGSSMLVGYITKANGGVHVLDKVITDEDVILNHLLFLVYLGATPDDKVLVEPERAYSGAEGIGGQGRGRGGGAGGNGSGGKSRGRDRQKHDAGRSAKKGGTTSTRKKGGQVHTKGSKRSRGGLTQLMGPNQVLTVPSSPQQFTARTLALHDALYA